MMIFCQLKIFQETSDVILYLLSAKHEYISFNRLSHLLNNKVSWLNYTETRIKFLEGDIAFCLVYGVGERKDLKPFGL